MKIVTFNAPIIVSKLEAHQEIKESVIQAISNMGRFSYTTGNGIQKITHTDWHLDKKFSRPYWDIVEPHLLKINEKICTRLLYKAHDIENNWFQWYEKGDFHSLHTHEHVMFSNVYYLNFNSQSPKTTFVLNNQEFEIEVEEGDVVTFPSFLAHRSNLNTSDEAKIVIAFNSNFYLE